MSGKRRAKRAGVWVHLKTGTSVGVFLLVLGLAAILIVVPKLNNATPLTVLTSSMEPGLPPGTLIVIRPVAPDNVAIGDVLTYQITSGRPEVITHRVIAVESNSDGELRFQMQGDNNGAPDNELVRPVQVKGKLWYSVPFVGYASQFMNGEARDTIVPIAAGLLFAFSAYMIITGAVSTVRSGRRKRASAARQADAADLSGHTE